MEIHWVIFVIERKISEGQTAKHIYEESENDQEERGGSRKSRLGRIQILNKRDEKLVEQRAWNKLLYDMEKVRMVCKVE